ncbi:MAG: hypothetical protein V3V67_05125 [Myxococcota bacterium]
MRWIFVLVFSLSCSTLSEQDFADRQLCSSLCAERIQGLRYYVEDSECVSVEWLTDQGFRLQRQCRCDCRVIW